MSENTQAKNNTQEENPKNIEIFALATDPIYIGTGGYTIGRVDNTIVRDPITNVPKIPGSSLAGTWRYYTVLEIHKYFSDDEYRIKKPSRKDKNLNEIFTDDAPDWIKNFEGNRYIGIKCAGQDDTPYLDFEKNGTDEEKNKTGHCGHCIICKGFGFSKRDISWQGMIFFSDLNILFFPVFTIKGTKWITTISRLKEIGISSESEPSENKVKTKNGDEEHLNLGWLYLEVEGSHSLEGNENIKFNNFELKPEDIVIVPEDLFSHIVNSNLEVRTSVSIDPITGAAKEGALFTSEAIPRGTIFYGNIRIFDKSIFADVEEKLKPLPNKDELSDALKDSRRYYETLGIGGMTTRGFGRLKINLKEKNSNGGNQNESTTNG